MQCLTPSSESGAPQNAKALVEADAVSLEKESPCKGKENRLDGPHRAVGGTEQLKVASQRAAESTDLQQQLLTADGATGNTKSSQASIRESESNTSQAAAVDKHNSHFSLSRLEGRQTADALPADNLPLREGYNGAISQIEIESTAKEKAWADGVFTDGEATQRLKDKLAQLAAVDAADRNLSRSFPHGARSEATVRADSAMPSESCQLDIADDEAQPSASLQWQFHHQALTGTALYQNVRFPVKSQNTKTGQGRL